MKDALCAIGILIIIAVLAIMYMGLDLLVVSEYLVKVVGG